MLAGVPGNENLVGSTGVADVFGISASAPCPADLNGNGSIDVGDFFAFIAAFAAGCP